MISAYIPHIVWNTGSWNLPVRRTFATFPKPKFHALRSRLSRNLGNIVYLSKKLSARFRRAFRYLSRLLQHMHFEKRKVALCCNRFSDPPRPSTSQPSKRSWQQSHRPNTLTADIAWKGRAVLAAHQVPLLSVSCRSRFWSFSIHASIVLDWLLKLNCPNPSWLRQSCILQHGKTTDSHVESSNMSKYLCRVDKASTFHGLILLSRHAHVGT